MQRDAFPNHILIIRLWPEQVDQAAPCWRITLEDPTSHGRQGFTEVDALLDEVEQTLTHLMNEYGPPNQNVLCRQPRPNVQ